jgi:hypothetical protein
VISLSLSVFKTKALYPSSQKNKDKRTIQYLKDSPKNVLMVIILVEKMIKHKLKRIKNWINLFVE